VLSKGIFAEKSPISLNGGFTLYFNMRLEWFVELLGKLKFTSENRLKSY